MRTEAEIKGVVERCYKNGTLFEKRVADTVRQQGYRWTPRQESIVCAGASFKGGTPSTSYAQSGDNPDDLDYFEG